MNAENRSPCPVACALDFMGDKWSLIIVRDVILGLHKYGEFIERPEGIPTNILANRLKKLVASGILRKEKYQDRPVRYAYYLTEKGEGLRPVLRSMYDWALKYVPHAEDTLKQH